MGAAAAGSVVLVAGLSGGVASAAQAPVDNGVVAWGENSHNQVSPIPAEALSGVTAVSAGYAHSLALKQDGSVIGWGDTDYKEAAVQTRRSQG